MPRLPALFLTLAAALHVAPSAVAADVDPEFAPKLVKADLSAREVRPGDPFTLTLHFRNAGSKAARGEYFCFVHIEAPERGCGNIVMQADHALVPPTTSWKPGLEIEDGPMLLRAPADSAGQTCHIHVGIYDMHGGGARLLDSYDAGTFRLDPNATPAGELGPEPVSVDEARRRSTAADNRLRGADTVGIRTPSCRFDVDTESGVWALKDSSTGVTWGSDPRSKRFGQIRLAKGARKITWPIEKFDEVYSSPNTITMISRPVVDGEWSGTTVVFIAEPVKDPDGIRISYRSQMAEGWSVTGVRVLDEALCVTETDDGSVLVPHRLGVELRAAEGLPAIRSWQLYGDISMAMCGATKRGSSILVNWDTIDSKLVCMTRWGDHALVPGRRMRAVSLDLNSPEGQCTLHPVGKGGYVEVARAYRKLAKKKGWLATWAEKRRQYPSVDKLFGALDFKPFVLSRTLASSRFSPDGKEHVNLGYTFDEVAECAEHWRRDLGIERAMVVLAGWINGGYDVRHPDVLPAAAECGGNAKLGDAARRIKSCGYLLGLHDNYQDMYENAPSWGQSWLNKNARGQAKMGGNWAGGQAWQVCAIKQVELAERRNTNLPEIARLFGPTIFFIDTVFAWSLVTCEDPAHPMTLADDLFWKTRLCTTSKKYFGLFGSEEGREWAVPCSDYLEGIFSHQVESPPGEVIPLFQLVYSDCVQLMTHQSVRAGPGSEKLILDHILYAEMPLPLFGQHLYWQDKAAGDGLPLTPLPPRFKDLGDRSFEITFRWRVESAPPADCTFFAHFTHPESTNGEKIAYQVDHAPTVPVTQWKAGSVVEEGPHVVHVPARYNGESQIRLGAVVDGRRARLGTLPNEGLRYDVGTLEVSDRGITIRPAKLVNAQNIWGRADGGWGEDLCVTDRVIKNMYEVLGQLNEVTAERPLDDHTFLNDDRTLQRTRFGDLTITVSYGAPNTVGRNRVPAYGFIVDSPGFIAFCATRYNGIDYAQPTLFTARSTDGKPISRSSKVRVYHGFGDRRIRLGERTFEVHREGLLSVR